MHSHDENFRPDRDSSLLRPGYKPQSIGMSYRGPPNIKVNVQSDIIRLYIIHSWSLNLFIVVPFQLDGEHTVLQSLRRIERIVHITISVLPGTHFQLSKVKHLKVNFLVQYIDTTSKQCPKIENMMGKKDGKHDISLKILHLAGFETARKAATSHALTISLRSLLNPFTPSTTVVVFNLFYFLIKSQLLGMKYEPLLK